MKSVTLTTILASGLSLGWGLTGCAPIPGDLPPKEIRPDESASPFRVEFVGKFLLDVPEAHILWEADPRNAVLCGDVLTVLYGDGASHRVVAVDSASGKVTFDSPLFLDPGQGGFLRVRDGRPILLWDSERPSEEPACQSLRYEKTRRPEGAQAWMSARSLGLFTLWSESWYLGNPHVPLVFQTDIHVETAASPNGPWARFTKAMSGNAWDACVRDGALWIVDGSDRDDVEVLNFEQTGFKSRLATCLRLSNPRIFALGDGIAVVGQGEGNRVEVFDPARADHRVSFIARWFESGTDGRRLFICGDNGDGRGPFLCAGTPDSEAWTFARMDQGWSPADGFFIATDKAKLVFGWISGRTLVVFRAAIP